MNKSELRKMMIKSMREISDTDRERDEETLQNELYKFIVENNYKSVGMILSMPHEINTYPIIDRLKYAGVDVYGPACDYAEKVMHFYKMAHSKDRTTDEKDIPVPNNTTDKNNELSLLVVPGLVFKDTGYRIGYGGGYYDKFLSTFKGDTVSIIFDKQLVDDIPIESHDIPVDVLITPSNKIQSKELRMNE